MNIRTRLAAAVASIAVLAGGVVAATPAHAAILETDEVTTLTAGGGVKGTVYWRNYNDGFAQLTLFNPDDGYCVSLQHRVQRGGVWGGWTDLGAYCREVR